MICEECKKEEQKSIITIGVCFTTAMGHQPFYDEEKSACKGRVHRARGRINPRRK